MLQISNSNENTVKQFRVYSKDIVVYFDKTDLPDLFKFLILFCEGMVDQVAVVGRDGMRQTGAMPILPINYSKSYRKYNLKEIKEFLNSPSVINYNPNE